MPSVLEGRIQYKYNTIVPYTATQKIKNIVFLKPYFREVAQPGSLPRSGRGGRRFESCLPDRIFLL